MAFSTNSSDQWWRKSGAVKTKNLLFVIQYDFGSMEKVKKERQKLWRIFRWLVHFASSNAQLLDVRQIEAFKRNLKHKEKRYGRGS